MPIFIRKKKLNISIKPDKEFYATREKATFKIKVTDQNGKPVQANLGVSVFDASYNNLANPSNIITHCYLSSRIRGVIYNPDYYFDTANADRAEKLDLLLLTQGWRRYAWSADAPLCDGQELLVDEITGRQILGSKAKSNVMQGSEQLVQVTGPNGNSVFTWADSGGRFTVSPEIMREFSGGYIYLKPMIDKEFKPRLEFDDPFSVINSTRLNKHIYHPQAYVREAEPESVDIAATRIMSKDSSILLGEVTIKAKGKKAFRDKFLGKLDSLAQLDPAGPWVCECQGNDGKSTIPPFLENYREGYTHHPDWDYKGKRLVPVPGEKYMIIKYTRNERGNWYVEDIDYVVYRGSGYNEEDLLRINSLFRTKGYYSTREFYQSDEVDMRVSLPDARNTLFWEPRVLTDERGEATITFYCSDINAGFIGQVEGTDGAGLLGNSKCEFKVLWSERSNR